VLFALATAITFPSAASAGTAAPHVPGADGHPPGHSTGIRPNQAGDPPGAFFGNYDPGSFGWTWAAGSIPFSYRGHAFPAGVANADIATIDTKILDIIVPKMREGLCYNGDCWGYAVRLIPGSNSRSFHGYGLAIDVNAETNGQTSQPMSDATTTLPLDTGALIRPYGAEWGGDWSADSPRDPMHIEIHLSPTGAADVAAAIRAGDTPKPAAVGIAADPNTRSGYWVVTAQGNVYNHGGAPWYGSMAGKSLPAPVVGIAATPGRGGYWLVTSKGNVYNFGAGWHGSTAGKALPAPVTGIAGYKSPRATYAGYWLVTSRGNVYNFGQPWKGSTAGMTLPAPIVGIATDRSTGGYRLASSRGNVYGFGSQWRGSLANTTLPSPIVGISSGPGGYLLTSTQGNVYNFNTPWYGSTRGRTLPGRIVGIVSNASAGYWLAGSTLKVYPFGNV
jgi:hypothetical protein